MAKKKPATTQAQYDKIFKENAEAIYLALIKSLLRIDTSLAQDLPQSDLQHTIERKADFLKRIVGTDNLEYALHIEIQADNHKEMDSRMLVYHALIYQLYKLDSQQFVIYIGNDTLDMPQQIKHKNLSFQYQIIDIRRYDYEEFLQANTPEEVILAILGNFHGESPTTVINQILTRLQTLTNTSLELGKYTVQLEIISQLRQLKEETKTQINAMPIVFDYTQTIAFEKGEEKGEEKGVIKARRMDIEKLLIKGKLTPQQIAEILEVPLEWVLEIEATIHKP